MATLCKFGDVKGPPILNYLLFSSLYLFINLLDVYLRVCVYHYMFVSMYYNSMCVYNVHLCHACIVHVRVCVHVSSSITVMCMCIYFVSVDVYALCMHVYQ